MVTRTNSKVGNANNFSGKGNLWEGNSMKALLDGMIPPKRIIPILLLFSALLGFGSLTMAQESPPTAPDNTGVNIRDRAPGAMTAGQQSSSKSDLELSRKIRRAVVQDESLSMMAHNVKIVSAKGSVTLRGPVKTEEEKTAIASKAQAIAGAGKVDNQLEVKGQ